MLLRSSRSWTVEVDGAFERAGGASRLLLLSFPSSKDEALVWRRLTNSEVVFLGPFFPNALLREVMIGTRWK